MLDPHYLEPHELVSEYNEYKPTGRVSKIEPRPINDFWHYEPIKKIVVADGSTCLCCDSKLPNHTTKCVLAEYDASVKATIIY